jgi:hypothetical protein
LREENAKSFTQFGVRVTRARPGGAHFPAALRPPRRRLTRSFFARFADAALSRRFVDNDLRLGRKITPDLRGNVIGQSQSDGTASSAIIEKESDALRAFLDASNMFEVDDSRTDKNEFHLMLSA